jgi:hypothetical protein
MHVRRDVAMASLLAIGLGCQGGAAAVDPTVTPTSSVPTAAASIPSSPVPTASAVASSAEPSTAQTVTALRALPPAVGQTYRLRGYVVKQYRCPPCPPGASCKPCMGNNVVISDDPDRHELYDLDDRDVIVFLEDPESLELGASVEVDVRVLDRRQSNRGINDLALVR